MRDRLDFYDLAVWKIREALADAYLAGMGDSQRLVDRGARLNPAAGEIGAGMLASLVEDARTIGPCCNTWATGRRSNFARSAAVTKLSVGPLT